jgi:hypothetical protein
MVCSAATSKDTTPPLRVLSCNVIKAMKAVRAAGTLSDGPNIIAMGAAHITTAVDDAIW